jgi:hypothetical protein
MKKMRVIKAAVAVAVIAAVGLTPLANAAVRPTTAQKLQLQYLVEEEKLARDVYLYFAANVTSSKFANIARAEQSHMDQVGVVLKAYNFFNPALTRANGVFRDVTLQSLYTSLTLKGSVDIWAAYQVAIEIENLDIADLQNDLDAVMPADMRLMMERLLNGSMNHLAAFSR